MAPRLAALLLAALPLAAAPASPEDRTSARAAFEEARNLFSSDPAAAVAQLRRALDLDPDYATAHQYYILYSGSAAARTGTEDEKKAAAARNRAELVARYEQLAREQPARATFQYALGTLFEYSDPDRAVRHFEAAVKLDPKCGAAHDMLGICAEVRGRLDESREHHRRAVEAEPDNITLWRHYVGSWVTGDVNRGLAIGREMGRRFPAEAASIMGYLAMRSRSEAAARGIYEMIQKEFPQDSAGSITGLFSIRLKEDRAAALALARSVRAQLAGQLAAAKSGSDAKATRALEAADKQWAPLEAYAQAVIEAEGKIAAGRAAEAAADLGKVTLPRWGVDRRPLELALVRALAAAGEGAKAYDGLLATVAKAPGDETLAALTQLAHTLGRDAKADLAAKRAAAAKPGLPFALTDYRTGKTVSLEDYRGRVVLVNFWYPMCGPCRGEFPFLQAVLAKYRDRGFEILAINGHAPEDHMVLPLLQGWKLDFLPLKATEDVVKAYGVRGFPANFLVGPDGRRYYEPPTVSTLTAQRELELQIEALLAARPGSS